MKKIFLAAIATWTMAPAAMAACTLTNANVIYVSPNGNDSTAKPGCLDQPYRNPDVANKHASNGWSLIFLPGIYNLTNPVNLWNHETVIIDSAASIYNWQTNFPLFLMTNYVTFVLDGTITDAYGPGSPTQEQDPIGVLPQNGSTAAATNVLITGHGSIYGASECISFEANIPCSGRIENLHLYAYHSPINFCHGGHTFTIDGVTATVLYSTSWLSSTYNQAIYVLPTENSPNNITVKNCTLTALEPSSYCIYDASTGLADQFTLLNNNLIMGDGSLVTIKVNEHFNPVIFKAPFGSLSAANISPSTNYIPLPTVGSYPKSSIQLSPPFAVLPQVNNDYTLTSIGFSNMIFFNSNGVPMIAWSVGTNRNTYSAPLQVGPVRTNAPGPL